MARSTGIPRRRMHGHISTIIKSRAEPTTIRRVTEGTNALGEVVESESAHTEYVWLTDATEGRASELAGEYQTGTLIGLTDADNCTNIQVSDKLTYGGVIHEVTSIIGKPEDGDMNESCPNTDFWIIELERTQ